MPITAQCRKCAARYKVVDTAAGRRVKCRRCGSSITLPGGEAVEPSLDLRSIAELERNGQLVATTPEAEYEQYQSAVATLTKTEAKTTKKDYRSIDDLATPQARAKFKTGPAKAAEKSGNIMVLVFLGAGGLAAVTMFLPAMAMVNYIIGSLVATGGKTWGTVVAFQESASAGTMYLLVPFYGFYYRRTRREQMRNPMRLAFAGIILVVLTRIALQYGASIHGG